jgi:cytosine/creatinine deaminase
MVELQKVAITVVAHGLAVKFFARMPRMKKANTAKEMLGAAIEQARQGLVEGGIPVGGAIFRLDGTLISVGRNRLVQNSDPSMHGETDAFRAAGRQRHFRDLILVTTLAPCWYCTGLMFRFKRVIVGDTVNAQGGVAYLKEKGFDILDLGSPNALR